MARPSPGSCPCRCAGYRELHPPILDGDEIPEFTVIDAVRTVIEGAGLAGPLEVTERSSDSARRGRRGGDPRCGVLQIGSHIARYLVLRLLGEGGMGSVYLVEHVDLKTRHA